MVLARPLRNVDGESGVSYPMYVRYLMLRRGASTPRRGDCHIRRGESNGTPDDRRFHVEVRIDEHDIPANARLQRSSRGITDGSSRVRARHANANDAVSEVLFVAWRKRDVAPDDVRP